jgi:hypothetical protein|tara:strand:- start:2368 stop:2937 length:570 start_codon:yes stop_codon:yes gene_type:complete
MAKGKNLRYNSPHEMKVLFADEGMFSKSTGELNMFDTDNPDTRLFDVVDGELIKLAGSELLIFRYTKDENYDDLYDEHSGKVIYQKPITVFGHYDPRAIEEEMSEFGIELTNDQVFTFNKTTIENAIGRPLAPGDVIRPKFQNIYYDVFEVQEDSFESYGVYHLVCAAKILRDAEGLLGNQYIPDSQIG